MAQFDLVTLSLFLTQFSPECRVCQQRLEILYGKKLAHLPSFSPIQSAPKALIFVVFDTYFVTFAP